MRSFAAVIATLPLLLVVGYLSAQGFADQLRSAERERLRALVEADVEVAGRLHAEDFQLINPLGGSLTKAEYLGAIASGEIDYLLWEPETIEVKLYGDAAVIRYQAQLQIKVRAIPDALPGGSGIQTCTRGGMAFGKSSGRRRLRFSSGLQQAYRPVTRGR